MKDSRWRRSVHQWLTLHEAEQPPASCPDHLRFSAVESAFAAINCVSKGMVDEGVASPVEMAIATLHNAGHVLAAAFQSQQLSEKEIRAMLGRHCMLLDRIAESVEGGLGPASVCLRK